MKRAKFITTNANGILLFDRFQFQTAFCSIKNSAKVSSLVRHSSSLSLLPRGESKAYISCQIIVRLRQRLKFWLKFQSAAVDACECNCAKQTILQMKFKIANIISSRQTRKRRWKISIYYEFLSKSWKIRRGKNAISLSDVPVILIKGSQDGGVVGGTKGKKPPVLERKDRKCPWSDSDSDAFEKSMNYVAFEFSHLFAPKCAQNSSELVRFGRKDIFCSFASEFEYIIWIM